MSLVLKNYLLAEVTYLLTQFKMSKCFLGNADEADKNNVNEQYNTEL